jgi:hypothetical protein
MLLPLEISKDIQNFLRPVEGFEIKKGQRFALCGDDYIIINDVRHMKNKNVIFIQGDRVITNKFYAFNISINKPLNKFHNMSFPNDTFDFCFDDIIINKDNLIEI